MPRSHWSAACLLHLPVVEGLIFCISGTPHLGTSFPFFHEWNISLIHFLFCPRKLKRKPIKSSLEWSSQIQNSPTNRPLCYQPYSSIHPNPKIAFVLFEAQNIRLCYAVWTRGRTLITFRFYGVAAPLVYAQAHCTCNAHAKFPFRIFRIYNIFIFINVI